MENKKNDLAKVLWYYNMIPSFTSNNQKIVCPFHADQNPSMMINLAENKWFCFGCQKSGNAFDFVKLMENKNDLESYLKYIRILRSKKCSDVHISKAIKPKKPCKVLYDEAYSLYHGLPKVDWRVCQTVEEKSIRKYMLDRGFTPRTLNKIQAKINISQSYPIIFPMLDNGKFKGWVCRTNSKEVEQKRKYLYNEGFRRANTLVGSYGKKDYIFVVEGFMDRLKFIQYGEENVVAILGWKMSDQQIQKLKDKGITKVISALDNDPCGKKGSEYLKRFFEVTRFQYLKGIKDPGEMTEELFDKMYNRTMKVFRRKKVNGTY